MNFFGGIAVVIGVAAGEFYIGTQFTKAVFEGFGDGDTADGGDVFVFEEVEGFLFVGDEVFEVKRAVGALDDFGGAVVFADTLDEFVIGFAIAFGDEDVGCPAQVLGWLTESATGEEIFVSKGSEAVDEDDVEAMTEAKVLEAIVEEDGIDFVFADGGEAAFDAILIDEDDDVFEIVREHVWFIAGGAGVEEEGFAVGDEPGWVDGGFSFDFIFEALAEGRFDALVSAAEDCDFASAVGEGFSELFDDGGFSGAADGEVSDGDDEAAEISFAEDAIAIQGEAEADGTIVDVGEAVEAGAEDGGTGALSAFQNDVDGELLEIFLPLTHRVGLGCRCGLQRR